MKVLLTTYQNNQSYSALYGLVAMASYIESYAEVKVIDAQRQLLFKTIDAWKPDIIAMPSYTVWYDKVIKQAHLIKSRAPYAKLVLGGYHITSLPSSFKNPPFDYGVLGEGEEVLAQLCQGKNPKQIAGLITKANENAQNAWSLDITKLPVVNLPKYTLKSFYPNIVGMTTSRGCYFNCKYCNIRSMTKGVRFRPVEIVLDEIELYYKELHVETIIFWDDVFGLNAKWLNQLIDGLIKRNLLGKIQYHIHVRASTVTEKRCELWKKLGVVIWNMGLDFGDNEMLKQVKGKDCSVEKNKKALLMAGKFGFATGGSVIFGAPNETLEQMKKTLNFMNWYADMKDQNLFHSTSSIWFFVATPLPKTEWWNFALKNNRVVPDMDLRRLSLHNWKEHLLLSEEVSNEEFNWIHEEAKKAMIRINGSWGEP